MENVIVYSTPTCPWCDRLKGYLREKGVSYEERDVSRDREAARRMIELTGQRSVPVTVVGDRVIVGYDRAELDKYLQ